LEKIMVTWMEHPKHGKHPAAGHEIESLKANGWTICAPKVKSDQRQELSAPVAEHIDLIATPLQQSFQDHAKDKPRRGRQPKAGQ
jgi:hypothetical protein